MSGLVANTDRPQVSFIGETPCVARIPGGCRLLVSTHAGCWHRASRSDSFLNEAAMVKHVSSWYSVERAKGVRCMGSRDTLAPGCGISQLEKVSRPRVLGVTSSTPSMKTSDRAPSAAVPAGTVGARFLVPALPRGRTVYGRPPSSSACNRTVCRGPRANHRRKAASSPTPWPLPSPWWYVRSSVGSGGPPCGFHLPAGCSALPHRDRPLTHGSAFKCCVVDAE